MLIDLKIDIKYFGRSFKMVSMVVGFIGLGNMGGLMVVNFVKVGYWVLGFDLFEEVMVIFESVGGEWVFLVVVLVFEVDVIVIMLLVGKYVCVIYIGEGGILDYVCDGMFLIDFFMIDVDSVCVVFEVVVVKGMLMVDVFVFGGVVGVVVGILIFMVGGMESVFEVV